MEKKKELRYGARHKGDIIVTTILNKEKTTTKRVRNTVKIVAGIVKDKIQPTSIKNIFYVKPELIFGNIVMANKCLDFNNSRDRKNAEIY